MDFKRANNVVQEDKKDEKREEKKFRFANQYVMLTYKTWFEKQPMREYFMKEFGAKELEIGHETGKEGYKHTHVVINFGKAFHSRNVRVFDLNEIHPHIQPFKRHEWAIKINYISKEDPENAHLKKGNLPTLASRVWACETVQEALVTCQRPSDVNGILALYNNKPKEEKKAFDLTLRPWQAQILEMLEKPPNDRTIIWIRDEIGGAGKSKFTKYMRINNGALVLTQFGSLKDAAQLMATGLKNGWDQKIVIVDLARAFVDREIYTAMEQIKNGEMTSPKYTGEFVDFESPHLVVMANFWPSHLTQMTLDRWKLIDLVKDKTTETYNIKEVSVYDLLNADKKEIC